MTEVKHRDGRIERVVLVEKERPNFPLNDWEYVVSVERPPVPEPPRQRWNPEVRTTFRGSRGYQPIRDLEAVIKLYEAAGLEGVDDLRATCERAWALWRHRGGKNLPRGHWDALVAGVAAGEVSVEEATAKILEDAYRVVPELAETRGSVLSRAALKLANDTVRPIVEGEAIVVDKLRPIVAGIVDEVAKLAAGPLAGVRSAEQAVTDTKAAKAWARFRELETKWEAIHAAVDELRMREVLPASMDRRRNVYPPKFAPIEHRYARPDLVPDGASLLDVAGNDEIRPGIYTADEVVEFARVYDPYGSDGNSDGSSASQG